MQKLKYKTVGKISKEAILKRLKREHQKLQNILNEELSEQNILFKSTSIKKLFKESIEEHKEKEKTSIGEYYLNITSFYSKNAEKFYLLKCNNCQQLLILNNKNIYSQTEHHLSKHNITFKIQSNTLKRLGSESYLFWKSGNNAIFNIMVKRYQKEKERLKEREIKKYFNIKEVDKYTYEIFKQYPKTLAIIEKGKTPYLVKTREKEQKIRKQKYVAKKIFNMKEGKYQYVNSIGYERKRKQYTIYKTYLYSLEKPFF